MIFLSAYCSGNGGLISISDKQGTGAVLFWIESESTADTFSARENVLHEDSERS